MKYALWGSMLMCVLVLGGYAYYLQIATPTPKSMKPMSTGELGGYPRPMGFRRIASEYMDEIMYYDAIVVDTISYHPQLAIEFKKRRPEAIVLIQINWESYGLWGTWHSTPPQIAAAKGWPYDTVLFPYPRFNGYWIASYPKMVLKDIPANVEEFTVEVENTSDLGPQQAYRHLGGSVSTYPDAMIYALDDEGKPNFLRSEFAQIVSVNQQENTVTLRRYKPLPGDEWHTYKEGQTRIGVNSGQNYLQGDEVIKCWLPNLSKFCPKDPETGMNAAEWWAKHFADFYRKRVSEVDGLVFDISPFSPSRSGFDIDNDGEVDDGYFKGINYIGLGMYDFFYYIRKGSHYDPGLGDDVLIVPNGEEMGEQRFPDLVNGAENEEFPGYSNWNRFPEQFNLHLWWCNRSESPNTSYLSMRFPTDAYHGASAFLLGPWMHNNYARLGMATACFGTGFVHYSSERVRPPYSSGLILSLPHYMWDEYNAGTENKFRWLGRPIESMQFMTDHLVNELLPQEKFGEWTLESIPEVQVSGPDVSEQERKVAVAVGFKETPKAHWIGIRANVNYGSTAVLSSPKTLENVQTGQEYTVSFVGSANSGYEIVDPKYEGMPITVGLRLVTEDGQIGADQWVFLDSKLWKVHMTLVSPGNGKAWIEFLIGSEPGKVEIRDLSMKEGCAEVAYRRFEYGLVLMNGSLKSHAIFDLTQIDPDGKYRRIDGVKDPTWNNGEKVGGTVDLPSREALFLLKTST